MLISRRFVLKYLDEPRKCTTFVVDEIGNFFLTLYKKNK